jgi:hypothetical protein
MTRSGISLQAVERRPEAKPPRLLDQLSQAARQRGSSEPTMAQLVDWVRRFILFHGKAHPRSIYGPYRCCLAMKVWKRP